MWPFHETRQPYNEEIMLQKQEYIFHKDSQGSFRSNYFEASFKFLGSKRNFIWVNFNKPLNFLFISLILFFSYQFFDTNDRASIREYF